VTITCTMVWGETLIKPRHRLHFCNSELLMRHGSNIAALFRARSVELFPAIARCCGSFFAKCKERGGSSLSPYALSARYELLDFFRLRTHGYACVRRHKKSDGV
jgi:hypothetical protein